MTSAGCPEKLQNRDKAEMGEATASLAAATEISVDSVVAAFLFIYLFFYQDWMEFLHLLKNKEQH